MLGGGSTKVRSKRVIICLAWLVGRCWEMYASTPEEAGVHEAGEEEGEKRGNSGFNSQEPVF